MAVYTRKDSPFWWIWIEGTTKPFSSKIPIGDGVNRRTNRQRAEAIYAAAMGDLARGTFQLPNSKPKISFREWAEWYRDHVTEHQRSRLKARSHIKTLIAFFGDTPLHTIDAQRIEEWKTARAQQVEPQTVNRELELLKPLLRKAVPKYLAANPADEVRRFRIHRRPPIAIVAESAEAALLAVANDEERAMYFLGTDALLRLANVRTLRLEHDRGGYLEIVHSKTGPYTVPVSARLRTALDALQARAVAGGGFYFPRRYKQRWAAMNENTAFRVFTELCDRAGVPRGRAVGGITFHSTRHTGATRAARVVKLSVVKKLGNWASLDMLERYDHPDDPEAIRAVEAIGSGTAVSRAEPSRFSARQMVSSTPPARERKAVKRA